MSNDIAIAVLKLMKKSIRSRLEQLIIETDNSIDKAINELEGLDND